MRGGGVGGGGEWWGKWGMTVEKRFTVKTLNNGTPRPATVVVLNIKQFNFTMK